MKKFKLFFGNLFILFSFILILFLINIDNFFKDGYGEKSLINTINKKNIAKYNFIAHAGGGINNKTYTNSIPAVENAINSGFKLIELDLLVTNDNYIVGSHDWKSFEALCSEFIKISSSYSYSDFRKCNENLDLKLVDEFYIKKLIDENKNDIIIITDQIQNFSILGKNFYGYNNNLIIEAHDIFNYIRAKMYFPHVTLTFNDGRRYKYFVKFFNVNFIVIKSSLVKKYKKFLNEFINQENVVMVNTTNEKLFIEENLDKYATMFYTDFWDFNKKRCIVKVIDETNNSPCHTY